jgi:hypothetical protein
MSYSIATLLTRNLHDVFGENDPARRRAAIDELFVEDGVFYDPTSGVFRGRDAIDRACDCRARGSGQWRADQMGIRPPRRGASVRRD